MTEERLDEETERLIEGYGSECYEVGFQDAEDDLVAANSARQTREKAEFALRSRIRTLVEEASRTAYEDAYSEGYDAGYQDVAE